MGSIKSFDEYSSFARTTDVFGGKIGKMTLGDPAFMEKILGLVGESGEVADKVKKIIRDKGGIPTDDDLVELKKELGDVLWYVALMADYLGGSLEEIASGNMKKLSDRKSRKVIKGEGDNR